MKKIKGLSLLFISILLIGLVAGCNSSSKEVSVIQTIQENDSIRIGVFGDKPPFGFVNQDGENEGFDVFIANRFAEDLLGDASKVEFIVVEAASRVEYLESDRVDIILANFTVTDERKEAVDFATPYMKVGLGIVSPDGELITDVSELEGQKVIVNRGTTAELYFIENHPEIELVAFDQNTEAFNALKDGRGAALAHDNTLLFAWANENPGFSVGITSLGNEDVIAPAVKKGNTELLEWINEELETLAEEDFLYKAYDATLRSAFGETIDADDVVYQ
ncbi:MAG TPA: transporter substrate-binding domain-containing protein [Bacilli bacterium]|nr:transporter substrate-binding domain-containing protein [Bacilli bacterium]